jgi:hypothetical protein
MIIDPRLHRIVAEQLYPLLFATISRRRCKLWWAKAARTFTDFRHRTRTLTCAAPRM